jgi:hypothetical protein
VSQRSRTLRDKRRSVDLNLADARWDAVIAYATAAFPDQPLAHGVRELLLIGVGVDPLDAAACAARIAAYNSMIGVLRGRLLQALGSLTNALTADEAQAQMTRDPTGERAA